MNRKPSCAFWVFLPVVLLLIASLALSFQYMPQIGKLVTFGVGAAGVALLLVTYDPVRFWWAVRALGAFVFCAYALYLAAELRSDKPFRLTESRSSTSPRNALIGLILFGIPGLRIAFLPATRHSLIETIASTDKGPAEKRGGA